MSAEKHVNKLEINNYPIRFPCTFQCLNLDADTIQVEVFLKKIIVRHIFLNLNSFTNQ